MKLNETQNEVRHYSKITRAFHIHKPTNCQPKTTNVGKEQ